MVMNQDNSCAIDEDEQGQKLFLCSMFESLK